MLKRALIFFTLLSTMLLALVPNSHAQWALPQRTRRVVPRPIPSDPDSIIIKFKPGKTVAALKRAMASAPGSIWETMTYKREIVKLGAQVFKLKNPRQMKNVLSDVQQLADVHWAEPDYHILLLSDPDDTYFNLVDILPNHVLFGPPDGTDKWKYQWNLEFIQASLAWTIFPHTFYTNATKPHNAVKVAVIDTGIDLTHPDWINKGGTSNNAANGGQLDIADMRNMLNGGANPTPNDPSDDFGHGTHVSGIIGAATNNTKGISAIGHTGQVMPIKVTDPSGDGDDADVADAMVWAADHGAVIMNLSLAVNGGYSQLLQDAVDYCWTKNVLVVAAAGNDGVDYVRRYPAACNKVLAVAATTFASADTIPPNESSASYSNSGLYVGIGAPAGDASYWSGGLLGFSVELYTQTWSTTPTYDTALTLGGITEYTYGYLDGTSMASPHVAGLATLYAGYKGISQTTLDGPRKMIRAIQRGADNIAGRDDGGWTISVGHGRINALATLQETYGAGRDATTPGCIVGQVTYFGTPVLNGVVTAVINGGTRKLSANSKEDGTYRIPNMTPGVYTVTCKYFGIQKSQTVTVEAACDTLATDFELDANGVAITVTPHVANVPVGGSLQMSAIVTGTSNTGVAWSVISGPGTIGADGIYHAPVTANAPVTAEVQGASEVDPTKVDFALITIPVTPISMTFNTNPVSGGANVIGTVTLNGLAPAGGAVIALSSSAASSATVPATVTVPANTTSTSFTINTLAAGGAADVTIGATYGGGTAASVLHVTAGALASLAVAPSTIYATLTGVGTVKLANPAPAGGTVVTLSSGNTAVVKVPATVTVAAGATSATFVVTAQSIATDISANITATVAGASLSTAVAVKLALPLTLALNPTTVVAGKNSVGTVTLTGPAPTTGLVINLASNNTAAGSVPATVTIAKNKTSGTFTVTSHGVASSQSVGVSAAARGVTLSQNLTVTPGLPKTIAFSPNPVVGGNPVTATLTISGIAPAGGLVVTLTSGDTSVATVPASITVAAGAATATFTVTTIHPAVQKVVHITAAALGTTISPTLTVKP